MSRRSSGSEDEDTLLGSKSESLPLQRMEKRRINLTLIHFALVALLSSVISVAVSLVVWKAVQPRDGIREDAKFLPKLDIPPLGPIHKAFMPERVYDDPRTENGHAAWMNLFPKGKGYVSIKKIEAAGPVPDYVRSTSTDGTGRFSVAVFHQLHCLYLLQSDLFEALEANITEPHSHTLHCLDYLRESIICASDSTLEPFKPSFDTVAPRKGVDGYGTPHQCRDFGKLRNWAESFRYNDNQGFETYEG
ncbi:hypothetical protein BBK36DRAFT_1120758 [Trichoderma citrinoviride]|uniref:Uncharacterized protein n=1 Tax=Trichoderma citrinoviride TaxID=58853 RepID=A0A2T4B986_9HYPO|nr:hypothetical protein BBK36DRAFT_1120758 [Trichoderma citrinoviride]PTB65858.1 hypothetical protein BBK36DRAFT_1120758 [Trichoderma citrinoviride]